MWPLFYLALKQHLLIHCKLMISLSLASKWYTGFYLFFGVFLAMPASCLGHRNLKKKEEINYLGYFVFDVYIPCMLCYISISYDL